ncbi:ROK family protein [Aeromonas sp. 164P]
MTCYVSFDIGGTHVKHGVLDDQGAILSKGSFNTPKTLNELLDGMTTQLSLYQKQCTPCAICISIPGAVDETTGIVAGLSAVPYIHHFNIQQLFLDTFKLPIALANDANCAALAEGWVGAAKEVDSYACVIIGTGIGGGVVINNQLIQGYQKFGGEFGCTLVDPLRRTIWSEVGATSALLKKAAKALNFEEIDGIELFALAEQGHGKVLALLNEFYLANAVGIYNIAHTIDPELILIGGGISSQPRVVDGINQQLELLLSTGCGMQSLQVVACEHRNDANLIGAVYNYILKNN